MSPEQILIALRARYKVVLKIMAFTAITTVVVSLFLPDLYRATAAVVVEVRYADPVAGGYLPGLTQPSYMATQLDILSSDHVAQSVVKDLKLDKSPGYIAQWKDKTDGRGSLVTWIANSLSTKLDVVPAKDSNVIAITCKKNSTAQAAAACANSFAKQYIETSLALRVDPARQFLAYFDSQTQLARERLEKAQAALSKYQQDKGLVSVNDERYDTELNRMNELSTQLSVVQGQQVDFASRGAEAKGGGQSSQEVLQSPIVISLKSDLAREEAKLSQLGTTLGKNHPAYRAEQDQANELRQQLNTQISLLTQGINTNNRVSTQRASDLREAVDRQKELVLKLKQDRDGAAVLQRDVDFAQRAADAIATRRNQSVLESQTTQTNISILSLATEPPDPYFPLLWLMTILGLFAGLVIGAGVVLLLEWTDQRVRSIGDLAAVVGLPVLGVIASEKRLRIKGGYRLPWQRRFKLPPPGPSGMVAP